MKIALPLATSLLLLGAANTFADTVELNGITSLFGEKMAFMVLRQSAHRVPVSFALAQGESQFGIKLLALNVANHTAEIEQDGSRLRLRLSSTLDSAVPVLPVADSGQYRLPRPLTTQEQSQIDHFLSQDPDVQRIKSGSPIADIAYVGAPVPVSTKSEAAPGNSSSTTSSSSSAAGSGASGNLGNAAAIAGTANQGTSGQSIAVQDVTQSGGSTGNSAGNATTSTGTTTAATEDYTKEYWYKASLAIEQNRLATADQVINGDTEPLPRTPLTPSQTPASLVGPVTFFSNHIPGFVCGGSVDH